MIAAVSYMTKMSKIHPEEKASSTNGARKPGCPHRREKLDLYLPSCIKSTSSEPKTSM